jgi:hypothetical protein
MNLIALPEIEEVVMVRLEAVATSRGFSALGDDTAEKPN